VAGSYDDGVKTSNGRAAVRSSAVVVGASLVDASLVGASVDGASVDGASVEGALVGGLVSLVTVGAEPVVAVSALSFDELHDTTSAVLKSRATRRRIGAL
jgi:hypothetical protein